VLPGTETARSFYDVRWASVYSGRREWHRPTATAATGMIYLPVLSALSPGDCGQLEKYTYLFVLDLAQLPSGTTPLFDVGIFLQPFDPATIDVS
jgi:hypothetical protein